jgi:hypothetical protein
MSIYRIIRITGGIGYKVHVAKVPEGLRVIGIFLTEADARHWIATDQESYSVTQRPDGALLDSG